MAGKGDSTKTSILDSAQKLILKKGFSGTSLEEIIDDAGITKGGFFYHFKGRNDLARELLVRYLAEDDRILRELVERAKSYVDDPLQQLLVFLKLYSEVVEKMEEVHPGCLIATYTYESQQFDPDVLEMVRAGVQSWKSHYLSLLKPAAEAYHLREPFTPEALADMLNTVIEGGIILTKVKGSNDILMRQMLDYREMLKLAFDQPTQGPA